MVNIEGRNPVLEALRAGREIEKILILHSAQGDRITEIYQLAGEKGVSVEPVAKGRLNQVVDSHAHQGVIARAKPLA